MAWTASTKTSRVTGTGRGWAVLALSGAVAAVSLGVAGPALAAPVTGTPAVRAVCSAPARPGFAACDAVAVTPPARTNVRAEAVTPAAVPGGYGPADLASAYRLPGGAAGSGRTVAIVDAYDDPRAESDLARYRSTYGLPACTSANGCFRKVNQNGGSSFPVADPGWAGEISLDLDMVSAACPNCRILLVEASSASFTDLGTGVNTAVALGARYVSNSYGGAEFSGETSADRQYYDHPGVVITASAGDSGYGAQYPAASPYVTAVGGTSLRRVNTPRGWAESVWGSAAGGAGTGSGCSAYEPKPSWQHDTGCGRRTIADVAAVADPATGVAVYDSYQATGWQVYGGTSAAAPIVAAVYALAGAPAAGSNPASYPYQDTTALNAVTAGANGTCHVTYLCTGGAGYDGPTGLGTPKGTAAFLAR